MDGLTDLERLEEDERHARMRLEADRERLAHEAGEAQPEEHPRLRKLEHQWERAMARLHQARGDSPH